jgi:hypothetical protein
LVTSFSNYNLSWLIGSAKLNINLLCFQASIVEIKRGLAIDEVVLHSPR